MYVNLFNNYNISILLIFHFLNFNIITFEEKLKFGHNVLCTIPKISINLEELNQ